MCYNNLMEHKGYLTAQQIWGQTAMAARAEDIIVSHLHPTATGEEFAVLATDTLADLCCLSPGAPNRVLPRDKVRSEPDTLDGQLGFF